MSCLCNDNPHPPSEVVKFSKTIDSFRYNTKRNFYCVKKRRKICYILLLLYYIFSILFLKASFSIQTFALFYKNCNRIGNQNLRFSYVSFFKKQWAWILRFWAKYSFALHFSMRSKNRKLIFSKQFFPRFLQHICKHANFA